MTRKLTTRSSFLDFAEALRNREAFTTSGALRGATSIATVGRLSVDYLDSVRNADYIVYSYATPIAWHDPEQGWVMPDVRYSSTTGRHQSRIRAAITAMHETGAQRIARHAG